MADRAAAIGCEEKQDHEEGEQERCFTHAISSELPADAERWNDSDDVVLDRARRELAALLPDLEAFDAGDVAHVQRVEDVDEETDRVACGHEPARRAEVDASIRRQARRAQRSELG